MSSYEEILQQFKQQKVIPSAEDEGNNGNKSGKNKVTAHEFATLVKDIQLLKQSVSMLHDATVTKEVKALEEETTSLREELTMLKRTMALQQEDVRKQLQALRDKAAEEERRVTMLEDGGVELEPPPPQSPVADGGGKGFRAGGTLTTTNLGASQGGPAAGATPRRGSEVSLAENITQLWRDIPMYYWERSIWDLNILAWTSEMGRLPSLFAFVLLCAVLALQLSFCGLLYRNFAEPNVDQDTANDAALWREHSAHHYAWYDPNTQMSLAARLCEESTRPIVQVSGLQVLLYNSVVDFMGENVGWRAMFNGNKMVLLALGFFYMSVCRELNDIHRLFCALWRLPRGAEDEGSWKTVFQLTRIDMRWVAISSARFTGCIVLLGMRLFIMLCLTLSGTWWLVYEMDIKDLLLKAAALEYILRVDEMVFHALAPEAGRRFMDRLKPLSFQPTVVLGGVGLKLVMLISAISFFGVAAYYTWVNERLWPFLVDYKEVVCEMNLDFVYATAPNALGLVALAVTAQTPSGLPASADDRAVSDYSSRLRERVYSHALNNDLSVASDAGVHVVPLNEMSDWEHRSLSSLSSLLMSQSCQDHITDLGLPAQVRFLLQQHFLPDTSELPVCSDLVNYCSHGEGPTGSANQRDWGHMVRLLCPATCGCGSMDSGFVAMVSGNVSGCASDCEEIWSLDLGSACTDRPASQLRSNTLWVATAARAQRLMVAEGYISDWQQNLLSQGCRAVPSAMSTRSHDIALRSALCSRGFGMKPVTALCPQACGCADSWNAPDCPTTCSAAFCQANGWRYWASYFGSSTATVSSGFHNPCSGSALGLDLPCCELCMDDCSSNPVMAAQTVWQSFAWGFPSTCRSDPMATSGTCRSAGAVDLLGRVSPYDGDGQQQCSFQCRERWMAAHAQPRLCDYGFLDSISPLAVGTGFSISPLCDAWLYYHNCSTLWSSICPDVRHPMGGDTRVSDFCVQECR
mmetsp:Transcript_36506/g.85583  ORF Transcript_36506/g.85583 Transcript_36506/m.85583 type:complete len:974 (+) Transcript_36506:89-3010(+)